MASTDWSYLNNGLDIATVDRGVTAGIARPPGGGNFLFAFNSLAAVQGAVALFANLTCFALLYRHRSDNLNMRSTWLCSRNDLVANIGVLVAAAGSYFLASRWPDILVGVTIAGLFLTSAVSVLRDAVRALRAPLAPQPVSRPVHVTIHTRVP